MRCTIILAALLIPGCHAIVGPKMTDDLRAEIVADLAVNYAAVLCCSDKKPTPGPAPRPTPNPSGCVAECTCNGTGREKTGDGLSTVDCRCPDDCKCKPKAPPLVKVEEPQSPWIWDSQRGHWYRVVR